MTTTPVIRRISPTDTAKLVRKDLKRTFPGQKFSVRTDTYSGGSSIRVRWIDGPVESKVQDLAGHYKGANFDGMTDSYSFYDNMVVSENGPEIVHYSNRFIFFNREVSDEGRAKIIDQIAADNPWREFDVETFPTEVIDGTKGFALHVGGDEGPYLRPGYIQRGWDMIHQYGRYMDL